MATQCQAQRTQGVRIYDSKGFQGSQTLPSSLHAARPLFRSIRAPEAQHPTGYLILCSGCTSISPVDVLHGSFRETVAKVVGRLVPDTNGSLPASYFSHVPFDAPSPANLMSPVTPPNYEANSAKIASSTGSNMVHILGDRQRLPAIPPYPCTLVAGARESPGFVRRRTYLAKENVERPSTHQVKHRPHVRRLRVWWGWSCSS
jgi:hypothetical protein